MKRCFSILMIWVFLVHFAGFYIYFIVRLQSVRAEAKVLIQSNSTEGLHTITLSRKDYQLARVDDNEIEWQGNRYDVIEVVEKKDAIVLKAYLDNAETELFHFLEKLISVNDEQEKAPLNLTSFTLLSYTLPDACTVPDLVGLPSQTCHPFYSKKYSSVKLAIPSPPPWC